MARETASWNLIVRLLVESVSKNRIFFSEVPEYQNSDFQCLDKIATYILKVKSRFCLSSPRSFASLLFLNRSLYTFPPPLFFVCFYPKFHDPSSLLDGMSFVILKFRRDLGFQIVFHLRNIISYLFGITLTTQRVGHSVHNITMLIYSCTDVFLRESFLQQGLEIFNLIRIKVQSRISQIINFLIGEPSKLWLTWFFGIKTTSMGA